MFAPMQVYEEHMLQPQGKLKTFLTRKRGGIAEFASALTLPSKFTPKSESKLVRWRGIERLGVERSSLTYMQAKTLIIE